MASVFKMMGHLVVKWQQILKRTTCHFRRVGCHFARNDLLFGASSTCSKMAKTTARGGRMQRLLPAFDGMCDVEIGRGDQRWPWLDDMVLLV